MCVFVKLQSEESEQSLAFGGQALIEGVMMRTSTHIVTCVRHPENGIVSQNLEVSSYTRKHWILRLPFVRGNILMLETMYYGMKSLFYSANVALEEEDEEFTWKEYLLIIGMVFAVSGFFMVVPFLLTNFLNLSGVLFNVVEAGVRLTFFILYLYLVSRWGEIERVLQYHGAEHKTINAYEAGAELEIDNISKFSRLNPRCGTSFLFIMVLMTIVLFTLIPKTDLIGRIAYRIILIPALGAISYELLKLSDRYRDSIIMKALTTPGMLFQRLTTKEPTNEMIEVAVKALKEVKNLSDNPN
jgi:uncharacterized protein YqhQ